MMPTLIESMSTLPDTASRKAYRLGVYHGFYGMGVQYHDDPYFRSIYENGYRYGWTRSSR